MDDVLILGGSGFIGSRLCELLVERSGGAAGGITVVTRHADHARHLLVLPDLDIDVADVHDDAALERLVAGRSAVVNLVGVLHGDADTFDRVHAELPRRLGAACRRAGVRRIVHVSALGADPEAPSHYLRSKAAGEVALAQAGVPLALLRPSVVFGAHDHFLNLFAGLSKWAPVLLLADTEARFQPVWVDDVGNAILACLQLPDARLGVVECAGPKEYTLGELVRLAAHWSGHERPLLGLPGGAGQLQAWLLEQLPGEPLMSRDNLASLKVPSVATGRWPGLAELGIQPTALEAVAPGYLHPAARRQAELGGWRSSTGGRHA